MSLLSLSHSLLIRVSNLRASRGDILGSRRAKLIADKLERGLGLGFWGLAWSAGWDYLKNYAWRDWNYGDLYGVVSDLNELMGYLGDLTRTGSEVEKAAWVARNYQSVLRISKRVMNKLLKVFRQSGALREALEMIQIEIVEGGLLKDCLEIGGKDVRGVVQILKDLASQYTAAPDDGNRDL
ncbi:hypothetical protein HS088_TW01G00702 [Tripterygium wilfordii]|uniref:Uncharacterized protein n=1 Tax=Tripterygium wilfordii TaxID=458696 RepID=A0A7J7E2U9_TRIWF|nr:hypothetical protein HS088_TW01G00702 [Tripterygium wilfordii]